MHPLAHAASATTEFLERLPASDAEERWLVRESDELRVLWIVVDRLGHDPQWMGAVDRDVDHWTRFAHPRVSRVYRRAWIGERVAVTVADDRGPSFAAAAARLADTPVDRERWAVAQMVTIADALAAMARHSPGFVHRRLDDDRLFVDPTGRARLRAPIALVSHGPRSRNAMGAGVVLRMPHFLAPEQALGNPETAAVDVFALASNLAYALTGQLPFSHDEGFSQILMKILREPPAPVRTYAPGLDRVLERAFAKSPAERIPDCAALASELYECIPDAADYDVVVSDRISAWWPEAPQALGVSELIGDMRCALRWDQLQPTGIGDDVRHCGSCNQAVARVRSLRELVPIAGRCFATRPGA